MLKDKSVEFTMNGWFFCGVVANDAEKDNGVFFKKLHRMSSHPHERKYVWIPQPDTYIHWSSIRQGLVMAPLKRKFKDKP